MRLTERARLTERGTVATGETLSFKIQHQKNKTKLEPERGELEQIRALKVFWSLTRFQRHTNHTRARPREERLFRDKIKPRANHRAISEMGRQFFTLFSALPDSTVHAVRTHKRKT